MYIMLHIDFGQSGDYLAFIPYDNKLWFFHDANTSILLFVSSELGLFMSNICMLSNWLN